MNVHYFFAGHEVGELLDVFIFHCFGWVLMQS